MRGLASASIPTSTFPSFQQSKIQTKPCINPCNSLVFPPTKLYSSDLCLASFSFGGPRLIHRSSVISRSRTGPGGAPGSGLVPFQFFGVNSLFFLFGVQIHHCQVASGIQKSNYSGFILCLLHEF